MTSFYRPTIVGLFLVAAAGCGPSKAAIMNYREEQAALMYLKSDLHDLRRAARNPKAFADVQEGSSMPEYPMYLQGVIASAERYLEEYGESAHQDAVGELLRELREVEAQHHTKPSKELDAKLGGLVERAQKLEMRPMTAEEEGSITYEIKK